jgi:hypothetical protein
MVKTYKEVEEKVVKRQVHDKTICDLCLKEYSDKYCDTNEYISPFTNKENLYGSSDKSELWFMEDEITVEEKWEHREIVIDLCTQCFAEKLIPWIELCSGKKLERKVK